MDGGRLVILAQAEVVVAEAVEQAGTDAVILGRERKLQAGLEVPQGVLVAAIALVGQPQAAVCTGEHEGIGQLLREPEFLQVVFQRVRIVGEVPIQPPEQVKKIHLVTHIAGLARPRQAFARPGHAGRIIAPAALEVDHIDEGLQRLGLGFGLGERLLGGIPDLVTIGQIGIGRACQQRAGVHHRPGRIRLGPRERGQQHEERKAKQEPGHLLNRAEGRGHFNPLARP